MATLVYSTVWAFDTRRCVESIVSDSLCTNQYITKLLVFLVTYLLRSFHKDLLHYPTCLNSSFLDFHYLIPSQSNEAHLTRRHGEKCEKAEGKTSPETQEGEYRACQR